MDEMQITRLVYLGLLASFTLGVMVGVLASQL